RPLRIDEPIGAVPVRGIYAGWGKLSLGLFANGRHPCRACAAVAAAPENSRLSFDEMIRTLILLVVAGNETTTNFIGNRPHLAAGVPGAAPGAPGGPHPVSPSTPRLPPSPYRLVVQSPEAARLPGCLPWPCSLLGEATAVEARRRRLAG